MRHYRIFTLLILAVFALTSGFGCKGLACKNKEDFTSITLEYWGVWDTATQVRPLIDVYQANHPTIKIVYRNFRYDEYERKLLEAWADDRGPDIFAIPANWLKEYQHRIISMPASMSVPIVELQGTIKAEPTLILKEFQGLTPYDIKQRYVPVVYDDVVIDNQIYALPFYLDTLVTFYNSDLLIKAGIPEAIKDWHDLAEQAPKLTQVTESNRILQSAVSLGGSTNIPRFFDVLSNIMLQNEVELQGPYFNPMTDKSKDRLVQALNFYTDFARPGRSSFSWNSDLDNAFELFANGKLAYFFGYSYHATELRNRGLSFDWDITNFPQARGAEGSKYYTDYWINVVSKKSANVNAAWNFIHTVANENYVKDYLSINKKPTALKSLINQQLQDDDLRIFASQVLTADNWYNGYDIDLAEQYTAELIDGLVSNKIVLDNTNQTLNLFVSHINKTYAQPEN